MELRLHLPDKPVPVCGDRDRIVQVFTNLIGNALKFTPSGYIEVTVDDRGHEAQCLVADSGIGIAPENTEKVFDRFQQFSVTNGAGEQGTGLGLSIARSIVELHGGIIHVDSTVNAGSRFTFTISKHRHDSVYQHIDAGIEQARKRRQSLSVFVVTLENYAMLEKAIGPESAHKLFISARQAIESITHAQEPVHASGTNELVLAMPANKRSASRATTKIRSTLRESLLTHGDLPGVQVGLGFATYPDDAEQAETLLKEAYGSIEVEELVPTEGASCER